MYEKMMNDARSTMKPVMDMVEVNSKAVEKLVQQQASYMSNVLNAGLEQSKTMTEVNDPAQAMEAQKAYIESMSKQLMSAAQENLQVMTEAKDAMQQIFEASVKEAQSKVAGK